MFKDWNYVELHKIGHQEFEVYWVNPIRRLIEKVKGLMAYAWQELNT